MQIERHYHRQTAEISTSPRQSTVYECTFKWHPQPSSTLGKVALCKPAHNSVHLRVKLLNPKEFISKREMLQCYVPVSEQVIRVTKARPKMLAMNRSVTGERKCTTKDLEACTWLQTKVEKRRIHCRCLMTGSCSWRCNADHVGQHSHFYIVGQRSHTHTCPRALALTTRTLLAASLPRIAPSVIFPF